MPTPTENLRSLTTGQRFALLASYVLEVMPEYGYSGRVADFAICQAAHETGFFTSDLLLRADNAFGMRPANVRPQPRIGVDNGYAVYATLRDSVRDYFDRQRAFHIPDTNDPAEYIAATVASGYATAPTYAQRWSAILADVDAQGFAVALNLQGVPDGTDTGTDGTAQAGSSTGTVLLVLALAYALSA